MDLCVSEQYVLVCIGMNLHPVLGFHKTIILASCVLVRNIQPNQEGVREKYLIQKKIWINPTTQPHGLNF